MSPTPRPSTTITHACQLACVTRRTIYNWIRDRKIDTVRTAGGSQRIFIDSLWRNRPELAAKMKISNEQEIAGLKLEVTALKKTLGTLLSWLPQSANSPIRIDEASRLLNIMNGHDEE